jgi:hypothetical protein
MLRFYNVETHPKFQTGEMNATEILEEFKAQWDKFSSAGKVNY